MRSITDAAGLAEILRPRTDLLLERAVGDGRFEAETGPVRSYCRTVDVVPATPLEGPLGPEGTAPGQDVAVTQTVDF